MKVNFRILYIFLFISVILYSCGFESSEQEKEKEEMNKNSALKDSAGLHKDEVMLSQKQCNSVGIQFGSLQKKNLNDAVRANGYLVVPPQNKADVSVYIGGVVKSIAVLEGDHVSRGQTLAILEHPDYIQLQQDYLSARNSFILAEKEYLRQKELYATNTTAEKNFQKAENDYNSIKINMASLSGKLRLLGIDADKLEYNSVSPDIKVISPINGYINAIHASMGKYIDPNSVMFEVVNNSSMFIVLQVFENDISKIKPGQHLSFSLPNESGVHGEGIVYAIDKTFDDVKKSFSVRAKVNMDANSQALLPGTYVNAIIETTNSLVNVLPDESIVKEGESQYVFVLSRTKTIENQQYNIFAMTEVKTGISGGGLTGITLLENIPENSRFVVKGTYYIQSEKNKGEGGEQD